MASKPAPIAIVGGGPCGLTLARLLECAGIDYVVFERELSDKLSNLDQGGTLDIHPKTGQEALRRAGLWDAFDKLARRDATTLVIQTSQGKDKMSVGQGRDAPEIDRRQLRDILVNSLPSHRVRWGKTLKSVDRRESKGQSGETPGAGFALNFADGTTESGFRFVVGADGAWSKLRPLITPKQPIYSGTIFIEGKISEGNPQYAAALELAGTGNSIASSEDAILTVQQMSDRSYRVYMGIQAPQTITRPGGDADVQDMAKARETILSRYYKNFTPELRAFIVNSEGPWRPWPLHYLDPEAFLTKDQGGTWNRTPGVTLIGDAAHLACPNGEGVNQAMHSALALFDRMEEELGGVSGGTYDAEADAAALERAAAAYEADMLPRGEAHVKDGNQLLSWIFDENAPKMFLAMTKEGTMDE